MAKPKPFDLDKLRLLLADAQQVVDDGDPVAFTVKEFATARDLSERAASREIDELMAMGKAEAVRVWRMTRAGYRERRVAYVIKL